MPNVFGEALLSAPGVAPQVRSYCKDLKDEPRKLQEYLALLQAGNKNVAKLDAIDWHHDDNETLNRVDPYYLREKYTRPDGRIDHDRVERDIQAIEATMKDFVSKNRNMLEIADQYKLRVPDEGDAFRPNTAQAPFGKRTLAEAQHVDSKYRENLKRLNQLKQHKNWGYGLCLEWAQRNFQALAACKPTMYIVEFVQLNVLTLGYHYYENMHNVVRITEKDNKICKTCFDSWVDPTVIAPWAGYLLGNFATGSKIGETYSVASITDRYPK